MVETEASIYSKSWRSYGSVSFTQTSTRKLGNVAEELAPVADRRTKVLLWINMGVMCFVVIGYGMCGSLFAPFFPTEAAKRGISATVVGLIFGIFTLVMFLGSLISGFLVRELGLTFMIWSGTLLAGGSTIVFGLLDQAPIGESYVILCFAVRFVEGCGASLYNTAVFSIAAQLYPQSISTAYSLLRASSGVGRMIGPSFGGLLFTIGGFSLPFYVVGALLLVLGFLSMVLLQFTLPDDVKGKSSRKSPTSPASDPKKKKKKSTTLTWSHLYRRSFEMWVLTISLATSSLIFGYPAPTLALYFEQLGLTDPTIVGLVFLGGSLAFTLLSLVAGKMADLLPKYRYLMMATGSVIFVVCFFFIGPVPFVQSVIEPSIALTTTSYIILVSAVALLINPAPAAIMEAAQSAGFDSNNLETSAMVAGLYNAMWFLGNFASPPLAGLLMDVVGFAWGGFIMSLVAVCVVGLLFFSWCLRQLESFRAERLYKYAIFYDESGASSFIIAEDSQQNYT